MVKTNHGSAVSARRELVDAGYVLAFSPPGTPDKWRLLPRTGTCWNGAAYAIARLENQESTAWEIVEYPQWQTGTD